MSINARHWPQVGLVLAALAVPATPQSLSSSFLKPSGPRTRIPSPELVPPLGWYWGQSLGGTGDEAADLGRFDGEWEWINTAAEDEFAYSWQSSLSALTLLDPKEVYQAVADFENSPGTFAYQASRTVPESGSEPSALITGSGPLGGPQFKVFQELERGTRVVDIDVQIASFMSIGDPIISTETIGSVLAVRLTPVTGGAQRAEWLFRNLEPSQEVELIDLAPTQLGPVHRARSKYTSIAGTTLIRPGVPTLSRVKGLDGKEYQILMQLSQPREPLTLAGVAWMKPALYQPPVSFGIPVGLSDLYEYQEGSRELVDGAYGPTLAVSEILDRELFRALSLGTGTSAMSALVLRAGREYSTSEDYAEAATDFLLRLPMTGENQWISSPLEATADQVAAFGGFVGEVDRALNAAYPARLSCHLALPHQELKEIASVGLSQLPETSLAFAVGESFRLLTDWDVVVASGNRIPDPVLVSRNQGLTGAIEFGRGLDGTPSWANVDLEISSCGPIVREEIMIGQATPGLEVLQGSVAAAKKAGDRPPIVGLAEVAVPGSEAPVVSIERADRRAVDLTCSGYMTVQGEVAVLEWERSAFQIYGPGAMLRMRLEVALKPLRSGE